MTAQQVGDIERPRTYVKRKRCFHQSEILIEEFPALDRRKPAREPNLVIKFCSQIGLFERIGLQIMLAKSVAGFGVRIR